MNYFFELLAQLSSNTTIMSLGIAIIAAIVYIISLNKRESVSKLLKEVNSGEQERVAKALAGVPNIDTFLEKASNKDKVAYANKILDNQQRRFELLLKTTRTIVIIFILLVIGIVVNEQFFNVKSTNEQETENIEQQEVSQDKVTDNVTKPTQDEETIIVSDTQTILPLEKEFLTVKITVNSKLINSKILVDGQLATIIDDKKTHKYIRVEKKDEMHHFVLINGKDTCRLNRLITQDNQLLYCSNI